MNKPNGALVRRGGALLAAASLLLSLSVGTVFCRGHGHFHRGGPPAIAASTGVTVHGQRYRGDAGRYGHAHCHGDL